MTLEEAKEVIAKYVVGCPVDSETLSAAWEIAVSDRGYVDFLKDKFGFPEEREIVDEPDSCDVFRTRVDELSEMSLGQMEMEAPVMWEHIHSCVECRRLYWQMTNPWEIVGTLRRLTEPITVEVDRYGPCRELGAGPVREHVERVALAAGIERISAYAYPETGGLERWEWHLPDEDAGCSIRITIMAHPDHKCRLLCGFEPWEVSRIVRKNVTLELKRVNEMPSWVGGIEEITRTPAVLELGSFIVKVTVETEKEQLIWEIALRLVPSAPGNAPSR